MPKSKKRPALPWCPCCKTLRNRTEITIAIKLYKEWCRKIYRYHHDFDQIAYGDFLTRRSGWACDMCIRSGRAILADPDIQNHYRAPYFAYFNSYHLCESCETEFQFSMEEKKHWYEELKFIVYSKPKKCARCRKDLRAHRKLSDRLSILLKEKEEGLSKSELEEIVEIYEHWEKPEKVKYYQSLLKKQQRQESRKD